MVVIIVLKASFQLWQIKVASSYLLSQERNSLMSFMQLLLFQTLIKLVNYAKLSHVVCYKDAARVPGKADPSSSLEYRS